MTTIAPDAAFAAATARPAGPAVAAADVRARDPRLDVFRGLAMFIILVAHTPGNPWAAWIPARFGFSDATEIFVFCSGMASAVAFGGTFARMGWAMGAARTIYRVWQIYWAHIGLFLVIASFVAAIDATGWHAESYIGSLNLTKVFEDPAAQLIGLMTLTYVPNYFDILPMYMAVLVLMPLVVALARVSTGLAAAASVAIWLLAQRALLAALDLQHLHLALPAEPWSDRTWFFNPFGWQLIFLTGFAFMRGWFPAPPVRPWLIGLAVAVVAVSAVLSNVGFRVFESGIVKSVVVAATGCAETGFGACNPVYDWRRAHVAWFDKTDFSVLHLLHFLSLAYLAWIAAGEGGRRLVARGRGRLARAWDGTVRVVTIVGQQSLAVFVFSMVLARIDGYLLDVIGRDAVAVAAVNLTGLGLLVACAQVAGWFKGQPWRGRRT